MSATVSAWTPAEGAEEFFIVAKPDGRGTFFEQLDLLFRDYERARGEIGLDADTGITTTILTSDSANQEEVLRRHPGFARLTEGGMTVTVVQQPPAKAKLAMVAYHVRHSAGTATRAPLGIDGVKPGAMGLTVTSGPYEFIYLRHLLAAKGVSAAEQTSALFGTPGQALHSHGIKMTEVVRTWIYGNGIDANYGGISSGRNRVFDRLGISSRTGFPASTGIEGRSADHRDLVLLDVFAVKGLEYGQNRRMECPTHMNPTVEYGVTFERGRQLVFGDRRHLYVSGTASIDNTGEIVHVGDISRQTERAILNVEVLLGNAGARLQDMRYLLVYLRDFVDADAVEAVLAQSGLADVPRVIVLAPVCRPGWLVEMEGVAVDGKGNPRFANF